MSWHEQGIAYDAHRPWSESKRLSDWEVRRRGKAEREGEEILDDKYEIRYREPVAEIRAAYSDRQWGDPAAGKAIAKKHGVSFQSLLDRAGMASDHDAGNRKCICWPDTSTPDNPTWSLRKSVAAISS